MSDFGNHPNNHRPTKGWLQAASWFCFGLLAIAAVAGIIALF
jgi:hypothetical protein